MLNLSFSSVNAIMEGIITEKESFNIAETVECLKEDHRGTTGIENPGV